MITIEGRARRRVRHILRQLRSSRPRTFKKPEQIAALVEIQERGLCRFSLGRGDHEFVEKRSTGDVYLSIKLTEQNRS